MSRAKRVPTRSVGNFFQADARHAARRRHVQQSRFGIVQSNAAKTAADHCWASAQAFRKKFPPTPIRASEDARLPNAHAGNAIGCWIVNVFGATNTPWDRMLAGNDDAMTETQLRGAKAFLTTAKCSQCHNGPLFTDRLFHNVATPQVGPGFGNGPDGHDDFGRERQTKNVKHRYQFRTPPLRNVELTAPYGHDGAIASLRDWVDHYSQSDVKLRNYNVGQLEPLLQSTLQPTTAAILQTRDTRLRNLVIPPETVDQITEFLKALTDPASRDLGRFVPLRVPSGLSVDGAP